MFKEQYHPAVKKDLRKIDAGVREKIKNEWIPKLLSEPQEGKELTGPLTGIHSYHFKVGKMHYRIAYVIEKDDFILNILMIAKRESFYNILRKRIR
ncbi:MAG: type II toxin-antitoxin system mRNA interferase toxin, RelE/StbE family [Deltaproteobacteria bacterium]|jgi:addiction module RelE/StbE family toxin|nr:type II toxin-antitoxin system mRNA interferase toxin, RelE/StbE family [Deltaproteobacteria bacterium]MBW2238604.1 type II toxin-antitoxin system mRNA interferase toxin, RelE/StbE family [Deltaproteobacteria bacterium]